MRHHVQFHSVPRRRSLYSHRLRCPPLRRSSVGRRRQSLPSTTVSDCRGDDEFIPTSFGSNGSTSESISRSDSIVVVCFFSVLYFRASSRLFHFHEHVEHQKPDHEQELSNARMLCRMRHNRSRLICLCFIIDDTAEVVVVVVVVVFFGEKKTLLLLLDAMVLRRSRSRRRRLGHASMEDGAAPNALSKCCCVTKTKVDISSLPPKKKKKKKKSLCLGFSHLGFRFVCLFGFGFFPFVFLSFVRRKSLSSSRHKKQLDDAFCRAKDDAGSSSFVVVGVFVLRFVCRANADGGDRHVFCSVVVFIHARTHLNERGKKKGGMGTRVMMMRRALSVGEQQRPKRRRRRRRRQRRQRRARLR